MTPSIQRRSTTRGAFPATTTNRRRRAAVALELMLAFPVLLVLFLAIVEFGLIYTAVEQVAGASRHGAKSASEAGSIANLITIVNDGSLRNTIDRFLETSGFATGACRITVQYNDGAGNNQVLTNDPGTGACTTCVAPTPPTQIPPNGNNPPSQTYVRVTVCVNLYPTVPDLLGSFGFSNQSRIIEQSTTFRLE